MPRSFKPVAQLKTSARFRLIRALRQNIPPEINDNRINGALPRFGEDDMPHANAEGEIVIQDAESSDENLDEEVLQANLGNDEIQHDPQQLGERAAPNADQYDSPSSSDSSGESSSSDNSIQAFEEEHGAEHSGEESLESNHNDDVNRDDSDAHTSGSGEDSEEDIVEENDDDDERGADNYDFLAEFGNRPVYTGAPLTVSESVATVLTLMLKHSLTGSCIADILTVIQLHCIRDGLVKLNLYKLQKYFSFSPGPIKKLYYCSLCYMDMESPQEACGSCLRETPVSYFIQIPLAPQIEKLFKRQDFYDNLQHRFTRRRLNEGWLEDIYDGELYIEHINFLSQPSNFSFNFFTDGVPVFKSKNYSLRGFYLTINELPYKMRMKRENTLLAGLWFGPKKPNANLFMSSFIDDFGEIYHGVNVYAAGLRRRIKVRGLVLSGVADLPAKSTFLNTVGHAGFYGCTCCEIRGETLRLQNGNDAHVYRYVQPLQKRTVDRITEQAREALNTREPVMGVKGPTALRVFMGDFVRGFGVDIMHLLLGMVKKIMFLLFDSTVSKEDFSLRAVLSIVHDMLLGLKPPKFIHRKPRSIHELCHWKASELKAWFFYYSVPILKDVMRPVAFNHYLKLVIAISYLNSCSVSLAMVNRAEELLHDFVREFEVIYGLRYCSINVHMLLHLADCVRQMGPTWAYSCFPYENINGQILRIIHGKTNIDTQVAKMHWQSLELPYKLNALVNGPIKDFCEKKTKQLKIRERIMESCYVVGCYSDRNVQAPLVTHGLKNSNIPYQWLKTYSRLLKCGTLYVAERYNRDRLSMSSYISFYRYEFCHFGTIYSFVKVMNCECDFDCNCPSAHYAIVRDVDEVGDVKLLAPNDTSLLHMNECSPTLRVSAVPVNILKSVCVCMTFNNNKMYVAEPVNEFECE